MPTEAGKLGPRPPWNRRWRVTCQSRCVCDAHSASGSHLFRFDLCTDLIQPPSLLGPLYKAVQCSGGKKDVLLRLESLFKIKIPPYC